MKTFTVTIAGNERFDGEAPYTWVVTAPDMATAVNRALAHHALSLTQHLCDLEIDPLHTFEGPPPDDCTYHWNDLRTATPSQPLATTLSKATIRTSTS
ncbi:hypothetical protein E1295_05920 [Nonomuraea mesophila]|uniref:Uncharacterized protein n=1 Tax=Nonomuraea mesophila TaxID=2530382 RepID=A0A4R5FW27_9ACTN|nr:hypothetical protein [Nonomuraea mesophila]TDE58146.1 hypothetical protein E1295_05920 [Nonomuraea mesophila]